MEIFVNISIWVNKIYCPNLFIFIYKYKFGINPILAHLLVLFFSFFLQLLGL